MNLPHHRRWVFYRRQIRLSVEAGAVTLVALSLYGIVGLTIEREQEQARIQQLKDHIEKQATLTQKKFLTEGKDEYILTALLNGKTIDTGVGSSVTCTVKER